MFVCFFVSLQPFISVAAMIGYFMMYWAQKYCMFYRYRRPVPGTDFVNQAVYQRIHLGPLVYSLGALTWSNFLPDGIPKEALVPNLVSVGLAAIIIFVPIKNILITCFFADDVIP